MKDQTNDFTINSVQVSLNKADFYSTEITTNEEGKGITQIPFGKYTVALVFIAYVFALAVIVNKFENKLTKIKLEEKKQK